MEKELIDYMIDHQIENNETDLKLLNIQLEFYSKLLENAKTKEEKKEYQYKIDNIIQSIDNELNDLNKLYNLY